MDVLAAKSSISDHNVIKIPISYSFGDSSTKRNNELLQNQNSFHSLDFPKANFEVLSSLFDAIDWDSLMAGCTPGTFGAEFHSKILSICLQNVPTKAYLNHSQKRKSTANNSRRKRKLLSRFFALKQHNPTSANILILESKLANIEEKKNRS